MTELKLSPKKPRENSREYVFRMMYDNIMSFQLVPGTAISEQDISSQLDISRTPVRDAFVRLAQLKLLDIVPQRKTTVSRIHTEQLDDSCFMRQAVECAIIKQACEKFPKTHRMPSADCVSCFLLSWQGFPHMYLYLFSRYFSV